MACLKFHATCDYTKNNIEDYNLFILEYGHQSGGGKKYNLNSKKPAMLSYKEHNVHCLYWTHKLARVTGNKENE